jgi:hypothetical protein
MCAASLPNGTKRVPACTQRNKAPSSSRGRSVAPVIAARMCRRSVSVRRRLQRRSNRCSHVSRPLLVVKPSSLPGSSEAESGTTEKNSLPHLRSVFCCSAEKCSVKLSTKSGTTVDPRRSCSSRTTSSIVRRASARASAATATWRFVQSPKSISSALRGDPARNLVPHSVNAAVTWSATVSRSRNPSMEDSGGRTRGAFNTNRAGASPRWRARGGSIVPSPTPPAFAVRFLGGMASTTRHAIPHTRTIFRQCVQHYSPAFVSLWFYGIMSHPCSHGPSVYCSTSWGSSCSRTSTSATACPWAGHSSPASSLTGSSRWRSGCRCPPCGGASDLARACRC